MKPYKFYLGTTEGDSKQSFCNHKKYFNNSIYRNDTTLSRNVWDIKEKYIETPVLKWYIVRTVPSYSNITKRRLLYLHEKSEILYYPNTDELLNKRYELIAKYQTNVYFAITNLTIENVSKNHWQQHPETFLKIGFHEVHAKYKGNYHVV